MLQQNPVLPALAVLSASAALAVLVSIFLIYLQKEENLYDISQPYFIDLRIKNGSNASQMEDKHTLV